MAEQTPPPCLSVWSWSDAFSCRVSRLPNVDQFMAVVEGVVRLQGHRFLRVFLKNGGILFNRHCQIVPITDHIRTRIAGAIQVESRAVYHRRVLPQAEERIDWQRRYPLIHPC